MGRGQEPPPPISMMCSSTAREPQRRVVSHPLRAMCYPPTRPWPEPRVEMIAIARAAGAPVAEGPGPAGRPDYDYIFIDCPPSLEMLTVNALCAADSLLVPVQCEYYALEGLERPAVHRPAGQAGLNPKLSIEGVLLTMFDSRTNLSLQVAEEVKRHFPGQVYATVIPRNVRLSEAPSHGNARDWTTTASPGGRGLSRRWPRRSRRRNPEEQGLIASRPTSRQKGM
ncbi:MAG: ParA family protein [Oscillospiraceae bacterium]